MNNPSAKPDLDQVEPIFNAALERTGTDRAAYLDNACGTDDQLRQRVETLLRAHEEAEGFLAEPPKLQGTVVLVTGKPGDKIAAAKPPMDWLWTFNTVMGGHLEVTDEFDHLAVDDNQSESESGV